MFNLICVSWACSSISATSNMGNRYRWPASLEMICWPTAIVVNSIFTGTRQWSNREILLSGLLERQTLKWISQECLVGYTHMQNAYLIIDSIPTYAISHKEPRTTWKQLQRKIRRKTVVECKTIRIWSARDWYGFFFLI